MKVEFAHSDGIAKPNAWQLPSVLRLMALLSATINGAGKTTLLRCLGAIVAQSSGHIYFD